MSEIAALKRQLHDLAELVITALDDAMDADEDGPDTDVAAAYNAAYHILHRNDAPETAETDEARGLPF